MVPLLAYLLSFIPTSVSISPSPLVSCSDPWRHQSNATCLRGRYAVSSTEIALPDTSFGASLDMGRSCSAQGSFAHLPLRDVVC